MSKRRRRRKKIKFNLRALEESFDDEKPVSAFEKSRLKLSQFGVRSSRNIRDKIKARNLSRMRRRQNQAENKLPN